MCEYCEGATEPIDNALWLNIGYCPICCRNLKAKQKKESFVDEYFPKKFLGATRYKHPL